MNKLNVNEIFYSLQGEGFRVGKPSIFIRLSCCNLTCGFCDTEFESYKQMELNEIKDFIDKFKCKEIVWTGGEPSLQLTDEIIKYFKDLGYFQCIETNGSKPVPKGLDFITVSPKVAEHILKKNFPTKVNELKYVRHKGQFDIPKPMIRADYYFLSPVFDGDQINIDNLKHCISLCLSNPKWRLSLQMHKLLKIL